MFKCVYKADMTEHAKESEAQRVPCERHLGLAEPITTKQIDG